MRREERTRLNNLRKTVSTDTVYVEVPMHFTVEGKQAIHELLTVEKGLVARRINWNPILEEYAILYSPSSDANKELRQHQETTDIETVMAGLKTTDIWWNGSSKKHDDSTDPTDTDSSDKKQEEKKMEKKLGKFERDQQTVDAILAKGIENLTHFDRIALLTVYQTSYHDSGKIEGVTSCDSSCHGCTFCAMMRKAAESDPSIICGKCYDAKQEEYRTNVLNRHSLNLRIMSSVLFTVEELATLPTTAITRINSSGDIENETHARNMIRFAIAHPYSHVTLWAKNYAAVEKAFDAEGKPENMLYIASSYRIDKPVTLPKYADFTFTVYSTKEKVLEAMAHGAGECNGKKCRECGYKCYLGGWSHGQDIAELLRK